MNIEQLYNQAENTWPPEPAGLKIICDRIGSRGYIGRELLHLGDYGSKQVSAWIAGHNQIPFSVWFLLLCVDQEIASV